MNKHWIDGMWVLCIGIFFGLSSAGWAANYYVDYEGGHESASGANPTTDPATGAWKYCPGDSRSSKSLSSGDTIYFKRGVIYLGTAPDINGGMINTVANNVVYTVTNWGTGQAVLDGGSSGEAYAVIKIVHDNITIKGLSTGYELRITGTKSEHGIIVPADEGSNRTDCTFSFLEVDHIGTAGVGYGGDGIKFGGGTSYGVQGATISYNKIRACYQYGLKITGAGTSGIDIHHNDIYGCAANNVYGTCQVNISSNAGQGVQTVDLHHNTIHDPYDPGRHYGVESNNVNNDIRDNEIYNNLVGIACDPSYNTNYTGSLRVYRNWIHDNTERGINISGSGTSSSRNVLAYNNKMKNNGSWEVHLDTVARNNQFYNNTIYTSAFGFHILSGGTDNIFKNNIVQYTGSGGFYCYQDQNASYSANTEDANIFYRGDGGNVVNIGGSSYSASQLAAYRNAANPNGAHTLFSDPLLNSVLTIPSNSPAKDEGVSLSAIFTSDYAGVVRPAGSGWDIGAYEYVSADTTPPAPPASLRIR